MDIGTDITRLLSGPQFPEQEFVAGGETFAQVYGMAAGLHDALAGEEYKGKSICLASGSKTVLAAALLASLAGGPTLLLPYSFSPRALARLRELTGFTTAITENDRPLPPGTRVIHPREGNPADLPAGNRQPDREMMKIFTGGTTGAPQVWSKTGENIFGEGLYLARLFQVGQQDRIVATVPPYHIYGLLFSVILPLAASATVIAATPSFPGDIADVTTRENATLLVSIPPHYRVLRGRKAASPSLRLAFSSAGMLDAEDNESFFRENGVGIAEVYGSTETGGIATRNRFRDETCFTPFPIVSWKIRDQRICVCSPFLSPDLPRDDDGFFICGDRVEACGADCFALKGRVDGVTKVGGKRVDLEEIRALIKQETGVSDCVVLALPDSGGRENRLAALIQGMSADVSEITKTLADSLEPYALPRVLKTIERIPLQDNGKYDRDAIIRLLTS